MERYRSVRAIVINKKSIKETDLLITLLTDNSGKITCLAKGAKNIKSRRLGHLEVGNIIKAHIFEKGDYFWISEATSTTNFLQTQKSLTQVNLLFYFLEITNRFIADNQQIEGIYGISEKIILSINNNQFHQFITCEIDFLNILGFGVTTEITEHYKKGNLPQTQKLIHKYFESIIEKPLQSLKLFH